jgi:murein DD-endopeptidase / murein LD-carboxypeptidase
MSVNLPNTLRFRILFILLSFIFFTVNAKPKKRVLPLKPKTTSVSKKRDSVLVQPVPFDIETSGVKKITDDLIWFARQQLGTPYKYASADPKNGGLDCSGFLYYVFSHFKIKVPRSSKDYMSYGKTIEIKDAQKGDVIVFTGSDASEKTGGHVGLILDNAGGNISFIHGSSGKSKGVTISSLSEAYYTQRFLKIVRVVN